MEFAVELDAVDEGVEVALVEVGGADVALALDAELEHAGQEEPAVGDGHRLAVVVREGEGKASLNLHAGALGGLEELLHLLEAGKSLGDGVAEGDEELVEGIELYLDDFVAETEMADGEEILVDAVLGHVEDLEILDGSVAVGFNLDEFEPLGDLRLLGGGQDGKGCKEQHGNGFTE